MLNNNYILVSKFNHQKTQNNDISKLAIGLHKKNVIPKHNFTVKFENIVLKKKENNVFYNNNTMNDIDIINTIKNDVKNNVNININKNINDKIIFNYSDIDNNFHKNNDDDIANKKYNKLLNIKNSIMYINNLRRKNIKIISNVYQETYAKNVKASGLGDFIRGCYFLLQFCEKHKFQTNIIINHPISMFLKKFCNTYNLNTNLFDLVTSYPDNNWTGSTMDSSNYIVSYNKDNDLIYEFINYLHTINTSNVRSNENIYIYNRFFPYNTISDNHRIYIREIFEPNQEMTDYINKVLNAIGYNKYGYSVIHIRSGDKYLNKTTSHFDNAYIKKIINEITGIIKSNMNTKFLLITDNNLIKGCILKFIPQLIIPQLRTIFKDISHLGQGTVLERETVKNTMLDFYLLSYSNSIHSYTCYHHGSGFSQWCAETYNIPYKCKIIQN